MAELDRDPNPDKPAPQAVISRVSLYLRQLESLQEQGVRTISSGRLGQPLGLTDAQVRKDLAHFGPFGHPGVGYPVEELIPVLRSILGADRVWPTALIGFGNLGRALMHYKGFHGRGFRIVALFDDDPAKIGQEAGPGLVVRPTRELPTAAAALGLKLAILTVPAAAAQPVADLAVACGIAGLLNFAPAPLALPEGVGLVSVDLSTQLEHLAYKVLVAGKLSPGREKEG